MGEQRRRRLIRAIEDATRPRCPEPGCPFRLRVCPVHAGSDDDPDRKWIEDTMSNNGRTGGKR